MSAAFETHNPRRLAMPILLVEDNPMDIDLTLQAFEEHNVGNRVVLCRDGEEAVRYVEQYHAPGNPMLPILVLLDLRLPKVDGLDVLRAIRGQPAWKTVPVVVLTTSRENGDITKAYELGANSYLVKPVEFENFSSLVKSIKLYWLLLNENGLDAKS